MPIDLAKFLARQLNDHDDSPSGVVQNTYTEWSENHIKEAVLLGLQYLYSIIPSEFSLLKEFTTTETDCVVTFCNNCSKFLGIVSLSYKDQKCIEIKKKDEETNNLLSMLAFKCRNEGDVEEIQDSYDYRLMDGSTCVTVFSEPLPKGTTIRYLCGSPPESVDALNDSNIQQYYPLIADYALWWLFRTDSESRSNLSRAQLHFESMRDFVQNKMIQEFSLRENEYVFGRRKVDG